MTPEEQAAVDAAKAADAKRIADLEVEIAANKALAEMTDEQKSHRSTLDAEACKAFDAASSEERTVQVEAAKAKDKVVFTSKSGAVYRASDDPRLVKMAQENDAREVEVAKMREEALITAFKARAAKDYANLGGTVDERAALLASVEKIEDEKQRERVLEILKSKDPVTAATKRAGHSAGTSDAGSTAQEEYDAGVAKIASEKGISRESAVAEFVRTEKGRELRNEIEVERRAHVAELKASGVA